MKVTERIYDEYKGSTVKVYTLQQGDLSVDIVDLGSRINALRYCGVNVARGFKSVEEYLNSNSYAGATVGRVANRIKGGKFVLDGRDYSVVCNNGNNSLHGGLEGFDKKPFAVEVCSDCVKMHCVSHDGEQGYPGELELTVIYKIENDALIIEYTAKANKKTLFNPTNHTYFNLDGIETGDCSHNLLSINADGYTPVDGELIPTGEIRSVKGTAFDFTIPKEITADYDSPLLSQTRGYDHNFVLNGELAARVQSVRTGSSMELFTDLPCLQFYSQAEQHTSFCLEPQFCPNAINLRDFAKPVINAGERVRHYIKYAFSKA